MAHHLTVQFVQGDTVVIDSCKSIKAVVISTQVRGSYITHQVSYWGDNGLQEPWIEEWRITPWAE